MSDLVRYAFRISASDVSSSTPSNSYGFASSSAGIVTKEAGATWQRMVGKCRNPNMGTRASIIFHVPMVNLIVWQVVSTVLVIYAVHKIWTLQKALKSVSYVSHEPELLRYLLTQTFQPYPWSPISMDRSLSQLGAGHGTHISLGWPYRTLQRQILVSVLLTLTLCRITCLNSMPSIREIRQYMLIFCQTVELPSLLLDFGR